MECLNETQNIVKARELKKNNKNNLLQISKNINIEIIKSLEPTPFIIFVVA